MFILLTQTCSGLNQFQSSYLIKAKEITLIDCGVPTSLEIVRDAIKKQGVDFKDISNIFVTHCEQP